LNVARHHSDTESGAAQNQEKQSSRVIATERISAMDNETSYVCPSCGEDIVIPVDLTQGEHQEYVEDCPVCCCPVVIRLEIGDDGEVFCSATAES